MYLYRSWMVSLSNKARGGVVYGQYTMARGCSYAWRNAEYMDTALSRGILVTPQTPGVPSCLSLPFMTYINTFINMYINGESIH